MLHTFIARAAHGFALACLACLTCGVAFAQSSTAAPPLRQERDNLILENIPPRDPALVARLDRYLEARGATFLDWLADGTILIGTRFGNTAQVHRVTAPLGMREQLTFYPEPVSTAAAPQVGTGDGFVFLKDQGGDENAQVHYYRVSDHSTRLLTDGKSRHGDAVWSNDGRLVAFYGTGRDGKSFDIYVADIAAGSAPRLVVGGQEFAWSPLDWSPDDRKLLLLQYVSEAEAYLHIADSFSGTLTAVNGGSRKPAGIRMARFSPDGRGVYVVTDANSEFFQLRYYDLLTAEWRDVTADVSWDIDDFDVSPDGRYLAYIVNENGRSRMTVLDTVQKSELAVPGVPQGLIPNIKFDRTGKRLALTAESAQAPRDVYVFEIERNTLVRWTKSEIGAIAQDTLVAAELVRYPTWDREGRAQRQISAYVYKPRTAGPHPVVISIHGGPEAQYRPGFDPFTQFLVNELGYAVIAPNVRGSTGYGKSFMKLDDGRLREDAVRDIGSLLVWIGLQPDMNRERVVVMGGSYGGYMTLASLAAYSDRLRGGVDVVGISNFVTFLEKTAPYRQDLRRAEYGDERDPKMRAFLNRISPLNNAVAIRRPLLVVQGLNDPRVPANESEQMVARIRSNGGQVWYLAAKDEGHGFRKKANRDFYLQTAAMFLERLAK